MASSEAPSEAPHQARAHPPLPGGLSAADRGAVRIVSAGHAVFAGILTAIGLWGLFSGQFVGIWGSVPQGMPAREALAYACAALSVACGIGVLWTRAAAPAARVLLAASLLWLALIKLPYIVRSPAVAVFYESWGETAVVAAGAWALYTRLAAGWDRRWFGSLAADRGVRLARVLFGLALVAFGLSHFAYVQLTASLVPRWLPAHLAWAYFTGSAYLAAGAAVLTGICAPLAAMLAAVQMGVFTLLVWVPAVASGGASRGQWSELAVSAALAAGGWLVAESYRGRRWLAVGRSSGRAA